MGAAQVLNKTRKHMGIIISCKTHATPPQAETQRRWKTGGAVAGLFRPKQLPTTISVIPVPNPTALEERNSKVETLLLASNSNA